MRVKDALKRFAYETFRPHSKEEYAELFSRGHGGDERTPYPWFYARILLIGLLFFTVLCVAYDSSKLNFLMVAAAGSFFADLAFIVLLVEIYPKRDLSLLTPIIVFFVGGIISSSFIYIMYGVANYTAPYVDQAWTAFVEETGKALAIIIVLIFVKKRNPFACFIIGAAVGGGYSAFENMWFMYTHGFGWTGLAQAIETGLWRALGTPFSHAAWAGLFGWSLSDNKPWLSWKPYAMYAFGYTMHFFVNFPLMEQFAEWKGYPISAVTGILSISLMIFILVISRRKLVGNYNYVELPNYPITQGYPKINRSHLKINGTYAQINMGDVEYFSNNTSRYKFIANVLAAVAIFCFSLSLLGPTCVFGGYVNYKTYYYENWHDVLSIVQGGREFNPDYNREYVQYENMLENYSFTWTNGELTSVTQRAMYDGYYYRYTYGYTRYYSTFEDEEGNFFVKVKNKDIPIESEDGKLPDSVLVWEVINLALELNDNLYYPRTVIDYSKYSYTSNVSDEDNGIYRYFLLNSAVTYLNVRADGTFELDLRDRIPVKMAESVAFFTVFFAAFLGCGVTYIVYKRKIRKSNF